MSLSVLRQSLRKLALLPDHRALPVEHIDRNDDHTRQDRQDSARPLSRILVANTLIHRDRKHGRNPSQEIPRKGVATARRRRVRAIRSDHIVDGRKVNGIVRNTNEQTEDHRRDPVDPRRAERRPREADQADGLEGRQEQEDLHAALGLEVVALLLAGARVAPDPRQVNNIRDEISNVDRDDGPRGLEHAEIPRLVDGREALEEDEDEGIRKPGEQREEEDDRLADEHLKGPRPDLARLFQGYARDLELVGAVDLQPGGGLAAALCLPVDEDCAAALGGEEVDYLDRGAEYELDVEEPVPREICRRK